MDEEEDELTEDTPEPLGETSGKPRGQSLDFDDAMDLTGFGVFSYIALLACSLIFNHSLLEMVAIAYIITPAECDLKLTVLQKSMINSSVFIGIVATSLCWGTISDHYGRRKIMLPTLIGAVATSFMSSLCTGFWTMFLFRLLTGCLISATTATVLVYLGELQISKFRSPAISIAICWVQISFVILPGIAWMTISGSWSFHLIGIDVKPWRVFMWTWGLVGISGAILLFILPESPSFVLAAKGPTKALTILARIYARNNKTDPSNYPVSSIKTISSTLHSGAGGIKPIISDMLQLVQSPMRRCYYLTHSCMFIVFMLANGLYIWMPDFINEMLKDVWQTNSVCDMINDKYITDKTFEKYSDGEAPDECAADEVNMYVYPTAMIMELVYLAPFISVIFFIDKFDKSLLYTCIMGVCAVGLILCCIIPHISFAMLFITIGLCTGSCASILSALAVEAFPTSLRALAMCTMYTIGQIGAVIGTSLISIMVGYWCQFFFFIIALSAAGSAIALIILWPDLNDVRSQMESKGFSY